MKCFAIPVIIAAMGVLAKGLENIWKQHHESIQYIIYRNSCTKDIAHNKEKCYILKLEARMVGCTIGS